MSTKKSILIVDDSPVIRKGLREMFDACDDFEVIGEATNGNEALYAIGASNPDVVTLDVVMPEMDGLTALKHIMIKYPRPTIMLSSLTQDGNDVTFDALRYGAVDFISKPALHNDDTDVQLLKDDVVRKVNAALDVNVNVASYIRALPDSNTDNVNSGYGCEEIVGIGAAEGGYGSLMKIIPALARSGAAYIAVLYVDEDHLDAFINYLNRHSSIHVKPAEHEEVLQAGVCYLSSGSDYLTVHNSDDGYVFHVNPAPFSSRRGSIDRLFFSIAEVMGARATGVILSGAGVDGVEGVQEINRIGGTTIVQDVDTSLSKEMPKAALNAITPAFVISDAEVSGKLNGLFNPG